MKKNNINYDLENESFNGDQLFVHFNDPYLKYISSENGYTNGEDYSFENLGYDVVEQISEY